MLSSSSWVNHCATMRATRVRFPVEVIPTDLPTSSRCKANSAFHPSEVGKWVPDNTGANSGSSTMRVAPIDHHRWYDRRLRTYDPGSVGRTHVNWVDGTSVQVCIVSFIIVCINAFKLIGKCGDVIKTLLNI